MKDHHLIHINRLLGVAWALIVFLLLVFAIDSFVGWHGWDSSTYLYIGRGILEGEVPYLDRWDNKGPLLYLLNAAGLVIDEIWGFWVIQGLFLIATSAFALLAFRKGFGTVPALFSLALLLVFYRKFSPPGNYTEQYALLFQFISLYLFLQSQERTDYPPFRVRFVLIHLCIGVLGAAAFLIRPNLVAIWLVVGLFWLLQRDSSIRKLAWAVLGGGSTLLAVAVFFNAIGAWDALWDAVFVYNFAYSTVTFQERATVVAYLASVTFPISLVVVAAWGIGVIFLVQGGVIPERIRGLLPFVLVLLPLEIASLSIAGFRFPHYFLTVLPVATLLIALLVWWLLWRLPRYRLLAAILLLLVAAFHLYSEFQYNQLKEKYVTNGIFAEDSDSRLAARIKEWTDPSDHVLVWGYGSRIYLLSERDAPSRYFFHFPLIQPHYTSQSMLIEFFTDVDSHMPELIVDSHFLQRFPPLEKGARANWQPHSRRMLDLEDFKPFFDFVEANYIAIGESPPYMLYALRGESNIPSTFARGELIIQAEYDVYLSNRILTYVRHPCAHDDARNRFILHVIPMDTSVIGGDAQANLDFHFFEGIDWQVSDSCIVSVALPEFPFAHIRTGQYNASRTAHEWLSEYSSPSPK